MAVFFRAGETKKRPGVYQRHTNDGNSSVAGAIDGICAIPIRASWGPLGKVVRNTVRKNLTDNYGTGTYSANYTVPCAEEMFNGRAVTVYTYRLGTGGAQAALTLDGLTFTAKYPGAMPLRIATQVKLGDETRKELMVYANNSLVEKFEFAADGALEGANLAEACKFSSYITISGDTSVVPIQAAASGELTGGADPTVTNEDYSKAFAALEPYPYNTIALDVDDDENMTLSLLLQSYLEGAHQAGKLAMAVVGAKTTVPFTKRLSVARSFNDKKVVFLGGGWINGTENKDGALATCYTAGVIASTPANQAITHLTINGATDLCESLTNSQYEDAVDAGMLLVSMSPDGIIWYDTGINTLTNPDMETEDNGWKKIRRCKVRFEAMDRIDRALAPKVGRISADEDGIRDVIQTGQRILDLMVNEKKLRFGATFAADPDNPYEGDSGWFVIQGDDIDSLEKIYLHYKFRYSQNV